MLREIAALRTLAGTTVPHPGFIAGCDDLDVLGVVFYLMEEVDGFNPGSEMSEAYVRDAGMRHQVGLSYAASLAQLGNVAWEGKPLAELKRPGSFLERQVPQFLRLLESYRHDSYEPESLAVADLAEWLQSNRPPDGEPGILHGDPHLSNVLLRRDRPELAAFVDWEMCTDRRPAARSRLDADLLAAGHQRDHRRRRRWPRSADWQAAANCSTPTGPQAGARRRGWTGISRWRASSSASSSRAPGRAT